MKKLLCMSLIATIVTLSACETKPIINETSINSKTPKIEYGSRESEWLMWDDAKGLVEDALADLVITGRVTGISFQVNDAHTGAAADGETKKRYDEEYEVEVTPWMVLDLVTLYDVDVIETYKGKVTNSTQVKMLGGIKDYRVEEQMKLVEEFDLEFIIPSERDIRFEIGETYLFVLSQIRDLPPIPLNLDQAIHNLDNPFRNTEYSDISAYDIISTFGEDRWESFWGDWQRDNPDWESRIDKAEVERVLDE